MNIDENRSSENKLINQCQSMDLCVIDQVQGQDGRILAMFFLCLFVDRDGAWSMMGLLNGIKKKFFLGGQCVIPGGLGQPITVLDLGHLACLASWPYNRLLALIGIS